MKKDLGRVRRNDAEEIRVSLAEVSGQPAVELRVYSRSRPHGGAPLPEPEMIFVPAEALGDLCQLLERAHDTLLKEGLVAVPRLDSMIVMESDPPAPPGLAQTAILSPEAGHTRNVPVKLPFECRVLGTPDNAAADRSADRVTGEVRVLSSHGALGWLPEPLPVGSRLAIFLRIGEMTFRGQAMVADVAPNPKDQNYRHTIEWLSLTPQAEAALAKVMETGE